MAKSPEYPDLAWVPPRAWETSNRKPKWIVIHTTEGSRHEQSAEDGAAYNARRTDSTSCHYHVDNNSVVQSVRTKDVSYCAYYEGNMGGIQYELCTQSGSANWTDAYHTAMLDRAATQIARDCQKWGIQLKRLTVAQLQAKKQTGFCGHGDISNAFEGDHTDPGKNFPWARFLTQVGDKMKGDDDMPLVEDMIPVSKTTGKELYEPDKPEGTLVAASNLLQLAAIWSKRGADNAALIRDALTDTNAKLDQVIALLSKTQ